MCISLLDHFYALLLRPPLPFFPVLLPISHSLLRCPHLRPLFPLLQPGGTLGLSCSRLLSSSPLLSKVPQGRSSWPPRSATKVSPRACSDASSGRAARAGPPATLVFLLHPSPCGCGTRRCEVRQKGPRMVGLWKTFDSVQRTKIDISGSRHATWLSLS